MKEISRFRVSHWNNASLGCAILIGKQARFKADPKKYAWFEARDDAWLREFQKVVRKLVKSVGHSSKFSISEDIDSGIKVERLQDGQLA